MAAVEPVGAEAPLEELLLEEPPVPVLPLLEEPPPVAVPLLEELEEPLLEELLLEELLLDELPTPTVPEELELLPEGWLVPLELELELADCTVPPLLLVPPPELPPCPHPTTAVP